jgi:hypothetical protein
MLLALFAGATSSAQAGLISESGSYTTDPIGSTVDSTWQINFSLSGGDDSTYRYFGSGGTGEIRTSGESTSYGTYQEDYFGADFSALLIDESSLIVKEPVEEVATGGSTETITATISPSLTPVTTSTTQGGTSVSVPEPGTLSLTMLGLLGLMWSRKSRSLKNRHSA